MSAWLQLSAGQGPAECAWAVARLAGVLVAEARAHGLEAETREVVGGETPGTCRSVLVEVAGAPPPGWLDTWIGTVLWMGESPFRPRHRRRNWYVGVSLVETPEESAFPEGALRFETMRAGGPGGQHANKTASAVRVTHVPTGLTAIARDGRSQHQNRKLALARLACTLAERREQEVSDARERRWGEHHALERGNPIRIYEGAAFRRRPIP